MRPALTTPKRRGCKVGGQDGRMAPRHSDKRMTPVHEHRPVHKKLLVHLIRGANAPPVLLGESAAASLTSSRLWSAADRAAFSITRTAFFCWAAAMSSPTWIALSMAAISRTLVDGYLQRNGGRAIDALFFRSCRQRMRFQPQRRGARRGCL